MTATDELPDLLGTSPADLTTPGPVADLTTARQRAERIRTDLVTYARMRQDIADAYAQRDWAALDYASWYEYLQGEFGQELQQLARSREDRQLAVGDLRGQGLSTRQIAAVAGVDAKTVRNDLAAAPAEVPDGRVTGSDGKSYPALQRQARAESEWEQVFEALEQLTGGDTWTRAMDIANVLGVGRWTPSLVTRRLNALQEGGRVDSSMDRATTGIRGTAWRPKRTAPEPTAAATAVTHWHCPNGHSWPIDGVSPNTCPTCGARGAFGQATAGTQNDPAGPVPTADDPPAAATSRDSRPEDRPGPQLPAGRDPQVFQTEPGEESPAAVATTGQPGTDHPIVLVASALPGQPPARAEVWEDDGKNTVVKVVYCDSRTGAWVARKRILGPAEPESGALRIAGSDAVEVYDHGLIHVGDRDLHLLAGRIDGDVPVAWLAVEELATERELLALNALQVQLLIQKLTAIHGWLTGEQLPDDE